jgi:membrane-bound metal-dependent hydrolase YbcI (DUF457 family)
VDLLTHVLIAYLITIGLVGFHPQYLAAGALAGGLPDADALLFPLARRFPMLRHRGITHSFLGVTIIAVVGSLLAPMILPGTFATYFLVMEVGGLSHIALDGFTNFAVPPLLPFSDKQIHFDAERAVNFFALGVSIVSFYVLLDVERNHVAFAIYTETIYALTAFFAVYLGLRLAGRLVTGRRNARTGEFQQVVPTTNPFTWLLLSETRTGDRMRTAWARYTLGRGITDGPHAVEGDLETTAHAGAPASEQEALEWSYPIARHASRMIADTYHFGEAFPEAGAGWVAYWYSLEYTVFGRSAAVRVRFPANGGPAEVKSTFYRPRLRVL